MIFGDWLPDQGYFNNNGIMQCLNISPSATYAPFRALNPAKAALPDEVLNAFSVKDDNGNPHSFCGTRTKLYKLTAGIWDEVGRGYSTADDGTWVFIRYGNFIVATNAANNIQKFDLSSDAEFSDLAGNPPKAKFMAVIGDFLVLGNLNTGANKIKWSGLNDLEEWRIGKKESGEQIMKSGGGITGISDGEFGLIFQETFISRMDYQSGIFIFTFHTIERGIGCIAAGSIVQFGIRTFYLSLNGWYVTDGTQSVPIGGGKFDKHFFKLLDQTALHRISAAIDPINKFVFFSYPAAGNNDGMPNRILIYNWDLGRASEVELEHEFIFTSLSEGMTLEQMDGLGDLETIPVSLDSRIYQGGARSLAAFTPNHELGFFNGDILEAVIETGEIQLTPGKETQVKEVWPYCDGSIKIDVGYRNNHQDTVSYSGDVDVNSNGFAPFTIRNRLHRFKLILKDWTYASGMGLDSDPSSKF